MLFRFFPFLIYVYFNEAFVKKLYEISIIFQYKFPKFISRCSILQNIRMSNLVKLKWQSFQHKTKFQNRFEIGSFNLFYKRLYNESFADLQINSN